MKYLSLDIETTGLDPAKDQILMIAAVVEDSDNPLPLEELPKFVSFVQHDRYEGSVVALRMNSWILNHLINPKSAPYPVKSLGDTSSEFYQFLRDHFPAGQITVAGKNVAGFDIPFLKNADFPATHRFRHRVIDPGSVCLRWDLTEPPSLADLKTDLLGGGKVAHDAYKDALDVIRVLRTTYR